MSSIRTGRMTIVTFVAALALLACSGHSDAPTEPVGGDGNAAVTVRDYAFAAATVTIDAGKSVRWSSTTGTFHTITPDGHQAFAERQMNASGATFEVRFDAPGRYKYYCSVHRSLGMTGEVVVR